MRDLVFDLAIVGVLAKRNQQFIYFIFSVIVGVLVK